jgi:hypothetical protein
MVYSQAQPLKPVAVYVITDGEPDDRQDVIRALTECRDRMSRTRYGAKAVGFQFAQVSHWCCFQEVMVYLPVIICQLWWRCYRRLEETRMLLRTWSPWITTLLRVILWM